jgi:nitric oxide reductase subunit B
LSVPEGRRPLLIGRAWVQAAALVFLFGFFVLGLLAYRTYQEEPPVPARVVDPAGRELYTGADVTAGQKLFLRNGLMQYGSIFGHGAYLGPDFTADYLHRAALFVRASYGGERSDVARSRTVSDFRTNRYSNETKTLELKAAQARAFDRLREHYARFLGRRATRTASAGWRLPMPSTSGS